MLLNMHVRAIGSSETPGGGKVIIMVGIIYPFGLNGVRTQERPFPPPSSDSPACVLETKIINISNQ